jgi:putative nucleotidyltransferase with HDIG domain
MSSLSYVESEPRRTPVDLEVQDLPPLPQVAASVLDLTSNDEVGTGRLSRLIERDQSLTAKMLRIANSAYVYSTREIKTVRQATVMLGSDRVRSLAMEAALGPILRQGRLGPKLWVHALAVGVASREIARDAAYSDVEGAFVAALLHDIGKWLFAAQHPERFEQALELLRLRPELSTLEAERAVLGMGHTEAGTLVTIYWRLPADISEVILHHHDPAASKLCPKLCAIVHIADAICVDLGTGLTQPPGPAPRDPAAEALVGLGTDRIAVLTEKVRERLQQENRPASASS